MLCPMLYPMLYPVAFRHKCATYGRGGGQRCSGALHTSKLPKLKNLRTKKWCASIVARVGAYNAGKEHVGFSPTTGRFITCTKREKRREVFGEVE